VRLVGAMQLYLVRHGEARAGKEDRERRLTDAGRVQVERAAWFAAYRLKISVGTIFHSGKTRARETAEIFARYLSPPGGVLKAEGLEPEADPSYWAGKALEYQEPVMLVGHLPHLARLASALLCGRPSEGLVELPGAAILCLGRQGGAWRLRWLLTPEMT